MGAGIAALAASAGVPVVLLDVPATEGDPSGTAKKGLERQLKARPPAFMDADRASLIRVGNTRDDLKLLAECDLVIEAIIEQVEPKRDLYSRLESVMGSHAIVASNTSGIPMKALVEGRSKGFRERFLGLHFFNPPRWLHLLEIIAAPNTSDATIDIARSFCERTLGKGTIRAKDVPGFVANRLGVYGMVLALRMLDEFEFTIDEVDALTGPAMARAKSATFRTADLTGLDVLNHVASELTRATGEDFDLPDWVTKLVARGSLGEKSGAGFYKKEGKEIRTLDRKTLEYVAQKAAPAELEGIAKLAVPARFAAIRDLKGKYGDFARAYLARLSHFVLERTPQIAYDIPSVDRAMEWGYAWEAGPFKQMDMLGIPFLKAQLKANKLSEPKLLAKASPRFYSNDQTEVLRLSGKRGAVPAIDGALSVSAITGKTRVLFANDDARLVDLGDGVACLEFRSKMNTISASVVAALKESLALVERDGRAGLVIGNDDPRTFTAGADLGMVGALAAKGDWKQLDVAVNEFQGCSMAIRSAPFPVVMAPFGLTLGGGCEFSLHADALQAHAELYMGLVEVGVGLIPGGGGTKELLFRFTQELAPYDEADPFDAVRRAFKLIAMATMSGSALEARKLGFLRPKHDQITMNRDLLIADAKRKVLALAPGYVAPTPRTITALGTEGLGNLQYAAWAMREAGQVTDFEVKLAREVAYVLCGGDGPPRIVTEQDILDLERESFLKLLGTKETQERIAHMLKTGKPLRN
jgi:3-hydroxyacyl-CoA dehydrogenase